MSIVESVTPNGYRCLTYFSELYDSKPIPSNAKYYYLYIINVDLFALIHQIKTPPHLIRNKYELKYGSNLIDYSLIEENLLPFPYETNCYDYEIHSKSFNDYQSHEDCIVKNLQIQEFKTCKCNQKWLITNQSIDQNLCEKCRFDFVSAKKALENTCRKKCKNQYFSSSLNQMSFKNNIYCQI